MILRIDHIGIIASGVEEESSPYPHLQFVPGLTGLAPDYGVWCRFWRHTNLDVEVIAPASEESAVAATLAARGPGLHHVAFEVDNLEGEAERLCTAAGLVQIDPSPRAGARPGMKVVFLYAPSIGLLVELVEYESQR
jgi:methylmalonyl-CoA/ethylmalonyl-CoA epimerase